MMEFDGMSAKSVDSEQSGSEGPNRVEEIETVRLDEPANEEEIVLMEDTCGGDDTVDPDDIPGYHDSGDAPYDFPGFSYDTPPSGGGGGDDPYGRIID